MIEKNEMKEKRDQMVLCKVRDNLMQERKQYRKW